jgi:hypothetical protein
LQDAADGVGHPGPVLALLGELPAPGPRQAVVLRLPVVVGGVPLGVDPPLLLEAVQRRVERPLVHAQHITRDLLDALRDAPPMHRLERERLQDQHVQRALQQILFLTAHESTLTCVL